MSQSVLISWVGFHDPFGGTPATGPEDGPVLTVVEERKPRAVHLFSNPGVADTTERTVKELARRYATLPVKVHSLPIVDPTDLTQLWDLTRLESDRVVADEYESAPNTEFLVSVSSGTPQMATTWFLLVSTHLLPGRLVLVRRPSQAGDGKRVTDVTFPSQFPRIYPDRCSDDALMELASTPAFYPCRDLPRKLARPSEVDVLREATRRLQEELEAFYEANQNDDMGLTGRSVAMRDLRARVLRFAPQDEPVLVVGERGTGKERVANALHRYGSRANRPMIRVNCASIPESLAESRLFGHKKGSFTGAIEDQSGFFGQANHGTLFLDEIGELSPEIQAKLLRTVQYGEIEPVGAPSCKVDVRLICATNRDLREAVREGSFRADLYDRVSTFCLEVPPLRDRMDDLLDLINVLLPELTKRAQPDHPRYLRPKTLQVLSRYPWPGNVRELENALRHMVVVSTGTWLEPHHLPGSVIVGIRTGAGVASVSEEGLGITFEGTEIDLDEATTELHRAIVEKLLRDTRDNAEEVSRRIGKSAAWVRTFRNEQWPNHSELFR